MPRRALDHGGDAKAGVRNERSASACPALFQNRRRIFKAGTACSRAGLLPRSSGALEGPRQVALDARVGLLGGAPKQNHDNERIGATYKRVYQGVLVHPVDLSEEPTDPVAFNTALGT